MEIRSIRNLHDLRMERDFVKQEIQLKYSEIHNEWNSMKNVMQKILLVGALQKVIGIFKKKE